MLAFLVSAGLFAGAQAKDTTLKEYVGKYTFPEGSYVTTAEVNLTGDQLMVTSSEGNSPLEKKGKDTFALVSYGAMVYFFRNAAGKVARIKVVVDDLLLEGSKEGVTAWFNRNKYYDDRKQIQAR